MLQKSSSTTSKRRRRIGIEPNPPPQNEGMLAIGMRNADVVVAVGHKSPSYFQLNQAKILGCSHHHRLFVILILIDLKVVAGGNSGLPVRRLPAQASPFQQKKPRSRMRVHLLSSLPLRYSHKIRAMTMVMTIHSTSSTAMDILTPSSLLPAVRATGRCPPLLIRDENIIEGGVFEMALLRALDRSRAQQGKCVTCKGGGRFGSLRCKVGRCGEIFSLLF